MTSGAIQKGVPTNVFLLICVSVSCPATPKSASFTSPCSESSTLAAARHRTEGRHPRNPTLCAATEDVPAGSHLDSWGHQQSCPQGLSVSTQQARDRARSVHPQTQGHRAMPAGTSQREGPTLRTPPARAPGPRQGSSCMADPRTEQLPFSPKLPNRQATLRLPFTPPVSPVRPSVRPSATALPHSAGPAHT